MVGRFRGSACGPGWTRSLDRTYDLQPIQQAPGGDWRINHLGCPAAASPTSPFCLMPVSSLSHPLFPRREEAGAGRAVAAARLPRSSWGSFFFSEPSVFRLAPLPPVYKDHQRRPQGPPMYLPCLRLLRPQELRCPPPQVLQPRRLLPLRRSRVRCLRGSPLFRRRQFPPGRRPSSRRPSPVKGRPRRLFQGRGDSARSCRSPARIS